MCVGGAIAEQQGGDDAGTGNNVLAAADAQEVLVSAHEAVLERFLHRFQQAWIQPAAPARKGRDGDVGNRENEHCVASEGRQVLRNGRGDENVACVLYVLYVIADIGMNAWVRLRTCF